jgi:hypothetical protein
MNIILKAFGGPVHSRLVGIALQGKHFDTCINITDDNQFPPPINAQEIVWMSAKLLREGRYPSVDWTKIDPVDEKLLMSMHDCEMRFLSMMERYALHGDMPYEKRKRIYLDHLRFWNHTLDHEQIGLYLLFHAPHQGYDYVIYELCRLKNIPTYHLEHCHCLPGYSMFADFERSGENFVNPLSTLREQCADQNSPIPLSPPFERFFQEQTTKDVPAQAAYIPPNHVTKKNLISKWGLKSLRLLMRKPKQFIRAFTSPSAWSRKLRQHHTARFYEQHIEAPDYSRPYIYFPLHAEPEESVSPRGGAFENQELIAQLLAACAPPDVHIYIKEHPSQEELCRSREFYQSLLDISSVSLLPRNTSTFELIRHSKAVATITGTAGFEALFREKPVLMFGHRFFQYAPGVHRIRTAEDCKRAMQSIFVFGEKPSKKDMRLFLKTVELETVPYISKPVTPEEIAVSNRQLLNVGSMMQKKITPLIESRHQSVGVQ